MAFKARKVKQGMFEVHGIEEYIERKLASLMGRTAAIAKKVAPKIAKKVAKTVATRKATRPASRPVVRSEQPSAVPQLMTALNKHPKKAALIKAGRQQNDQLLRSLIPLYLAQKLSVEVSSGATSHFWKQQGVKYLAPNAAKALREHVGYARLTKTGRQITPNGIKYVEAALSGKSPRRAA